MIGIEPMKRMIWSVLLLGFGVLAEENLLLNPGFEQGDEHWKTSEWSRKATSEFQIVSEGAASGKFCARRKATSEADNLVLWQQVEVDGAQSLELKFKAKLEIQLGKEGEISASFLTFSKDKKKLQYVTRRFSAGSEWREFSWNFQTKPDTQYVQICLRNRGTPAFFDDVSLRRATGVVVRRAAWDAVTRSILLTVGVPEQNPPSQLRIGVNDGPEQEIAITPVRGEAACRVQLPEGIAAGTVTLLVRDDSSSAASARQSLTIPRPVFARAAGIRKNNFVRELYRGRITAGEPLTIQAGRRGWIRIVPSRPGRGRLFLDDREIFPDRQDMFHLTDGRGVLKLVDAEEAELTVLRIPEIILCEFDETRSPHREYIQSVRQPADQLAAACNTLMVSFDGGKEIGGERMDEPSRQFIRNWMASGKMAYGHAMRPGLLKTIAPEQSWDYWSRTLGLTQFQGLALDEFAWETPDDAVHYCAAVKKISEQFPGKRLLAYCCAAWNTHQRTDALRDALIAGDHLIAPEVYLREGADEIRARLNFHEMFGYLKAYPRQYPDILNRMVVVLSCVDRPEKGYYRQDTRPDVNYFYFYDMQMHMLANDPEFDGLYGITAWISRYSTGEMMSFMAALYRHYCLEGNRKPYLKNWPVSYRLDHLRNPDFAGQAAGWTVRGGVAWEVIPGYGFARGSCNTDGVGDAVARMSVGAELEQELRGLIPGQRYSAEFYFADAEDVREGRNAPLETGLTLEVRNAEVLPEFARACSFKSLHRLKPQFAQGGPTMGYQRVVFRARENETPLLRIRHQGTRDMICNFVQVQPYFPEYR